MTTELVPASSPFLVPDLPREGWLYVLEKRWTWSHDGGDWWFLCARCFGDLTQTFQGHVVACLWCGQQLEPTPYDKHYDPPPEPHVVHDSSAGGPSVHDFLLALVPGHCHVYRFRLPEKGGSVPGERCRRLADHDDDCRFDGGPEPLRRGLRS